MALDGKILARVRQTIADTKRDNEAEQNRRRAQAFERVPALRAIEIETGKLMIGVASDALKKGTNAGDAVLGVRDRCESLQARKGELLRENGFPENYLDDIFACPHCRDTGYVLGKPCKCLLELYKSETARELSCMLDLRGQSFERFDLDCYSDVCDPRLGVSPRQVMSNVFNLCRQYAENFGTNSVNLLFRGDTGLGKTFLSACIARVVSEKGFSVVYDTSVAVMEAFELQKFDRRSDDAEETSSRVKRYLNCDLLILDDLGTEMTTGFTTSALYTLVNSRLINGGKTLISTNLSADEMRRRYSPQTVSRLEGEYLCLSFAGEDIRAIRRGNRA
ncbi:MAG: ATP-binding protein [Oscillospiraceae bacterium]